MPTIMPTVTRMPRMQGLPPITFGSVVTRSSGSITVILRAALDPRPPRLPARLRRIRGEQRTRGVVLAAEEGEAIDVVDAVAGVVERRGAAVVGGARARAAPEEKLHHVGVPVAGGH